MLDETRHQALDARLFGLLRLVGHRGAGQADIAASAMSIMEGVEWRPDRRNLKTECILRPEWEKHWARDKQVYWAWFGDIRHDEVARLLHAAFEAMARVVFDSPTSFRYSKHAAELQEALREYLDLRGFEVSGPGEERDEVDSPRPEQPTSAYCCLAGGTQIRWRATENVPQRLWHLLKLLLEYPGDRISFQEVEDSLNRGGCRSSKWAPNMVSDLNRVLLSVGFPWTYRTKASHIVREP